MKLLMLSSSRAGDTDYLEHASEMIKNHLGTKVSKVLFIPFAGVTINYDDYANAVNKAFAALSYQVESIHQFTDMSKAIEEAEAIAVGGGNTFNLLNAIYENDLIDSLRLKIAQGTPYIGWSAGSNICGTSIRTTNDMPIVQPPSFEALNLVNFQINPHYIDGNPPGHHGETREQRIAEFLVVNPQSKVVGIPEGTALMRTEDKLKLLGPKDGFIFSQEKGKETIPANSDISYLL